MPDKKTRPGDARPVAMGKRLEGLSPKRQELIRPVIENPRGHVLLSVRNLAQKLHVDPATVVRTVLSMGFESYREFQRYLHELSISQATSLDTMRASKARGRSLSGHVRETVEHDLRNIQMLRNSLEFDRVAALAKRIHRAKRVIVIGGDLAANLVGILRYHLLFLGLPVIAATSGGETTHLVRSTGKKDLIIAISFRRCLRQTVEGLQLAKANGAYCVGITDTFISPIARFSDECFLTSIETASYGASYVAPLCLLDGIIGACGYYPSARAHALLKKQAEEQRYGSRWYKD
jgi:RpiR family carbohydrate utilization transcriptional regulator